MRANSFGIQVNGVVVGGELGARADLAACSVGLVLRLVTPLNAWRELGRAGGRFAPAARKYSQTSAAPGSFAMAWISASCCAIPGLDRRPVVLILDLVERRRLKRQRARRIEGIRRPELRLGLVRPCGPGAQRGTRRQRNEQLDLAFILPSPTEIRLHGSARAFYSCL